MSELTIYHGVILSAEYVGSCSQDGTVAVSSLCSGSGASVQSSQVFFSPTHPFLPYVTPHFSHISHFIQHWYERPVLAMSLHRDFGSKRAFTTGGLAGKLVLSSKTWLGGAKERKKTRAPHRTAHTP